VPRKEHKEAIRSLVMSQCLLGTDEILVITTNAGSSVSNEELVPKIDGDLLGFSDIHDMDS
jgi:hypothetical protein